MWSWIYWWRTINVDCLSLHVHFWVNKPINFKDCLAVGLVCFGIVFYRFSAFWLRSKCSICSYQLNIWYAPYMGASILNWFLNLGEVSGACSAFATGWPGIAVPPGSAHSPLGDNEIQWQYNQHFSKTAVDVTAFVGGGGSENYWMLTALKTINQTKSSLIVKSGNRLQMASTFKTLLLWIS